jgi:hypothetical protein
MKKSFIVFVLGIAALSAQAQAKLSLGVKGGLNVFSYLYGSTGTGLIDNNNKTNGYHAGAFFSIRLSKIAIQPELLFSSQGISQRIVYPSITPSNSIDGNYNLDLNYVLIPVALKWYIAGGVNLQVGPQIGFLASARVPNVNTNTTIPSVSIVDGKDFFKGTDFGALIGLGWDAPFGLTIDTRMTVGFTDVNSISLPGNEAKNFVFQISAGYRLWELGK